MNVFQHVSQSATEENMRHENRDMSSTQQTSHHMEKDNKARCSVLDQSTAFLSVSAVTISSWSIRQAVGQLSGSGACLLPSWPPPAGAFIWLGAAWIKSGAERPQSAKCASNCMCKLDAN